jgi:hypothetical protein
MNLIEIKVIRLDFYFKYYERIKITNLEILDFILINLEVKNDLKVKNFE